MNRFFFALREYLRYYWKAKTVYNTDSKLLYDFYTQVFTDTRYYYAFGWIEAYRQTLTRNPKILEVLDLGAGSQVLGDKKQRSISEIAKNSLSPRWQGEFLFRLVNWLQPKTKLEMGTSLGVSGLYQYFPTPHSKFYTLEGCPQIAAIAAEKFSRYPNPPTLKVGDFAQTLPAVLEEIGQGGLDYAFIDGNHREAETVAYFEACVAYAHADTVLVLDDIHWSAGMRKAWERIQQHPKVSLSIDIFQMGIIFLRPRLEAQPAQHLSLIPFSYKPWQIGIFR